MGQSVYYIYIFTRINICVHCVGGLIVGNERVSFARRKTVQWPFSLTRIDDQRARNRADRATDSL